jgi:hypothetical protein
MPILRRARSGHRGSSVILAWNDASSRGRALQDGRCRSAPGAHSTSISQKFDGERMLTWVRSTSRGWGGVGHRSLLTISRRERSGATLIRTHRPMPGPRDVAACEDARRFHTGSTGADARGPLGPSEMERTRWIVVGTDFSEAADRALQRAVDLAAESRAQLACVHAFEDTSVLQGATDDPRGRSTRSSSTPSRAPVRAHEASESSSSSAEGHLGTNL